MTPSVVTTPKFFADTATNSPGFTTIGVVKFIDMPGPPNIPATAPDA